MNFEKLREFYRTLEEVNNVDLDSLIKLKEINDYKDLDGDVFKERFKDNPGLLEYYKSQRPKKLNNSELRELKDKDNYLLEESVVEPYIDSIKHENVVGIKHDISMKISSTDKKDIELLSEFFNNLNINVVFKTKENKNNVIFLTMNSYDLTNIQKGINILLENSSANVETRYIIPDFKQRSLTEINNTIKTRYLDKTSIDYISSNIGIAVLPFDYNDINQSLYNSLNSTNKMSVDSFISHTINKDSPFYEINQKRNDEILDREVRSAPHWKS